MNAFRGKDAPSLAFLAELLQLAPKYTLKDLRNGYSSSTNTVKSEASTANKDVAQDENAAEIKRDQHVQPTMKSFSDLSLSHDMIHDPSPSFRTVSNNWRSINPMKHPKFGHFKFSYSPFGTIEYEVDDPIMGPTYPRPRSTWLHVLPEELTQNSNESKIVEITGGTIIESNNSDLTDNSEGASILSNSATTTRSESSDTSKEKVYIPPHKRGQFKASHSRTRSDSSTLTPKKNNFSKDKKISGSLDLTSWQTNPIAARRTYTGSGYRPLPNAPPVLVSLPASVTEPSPQTSPSKELSDQSNYKGTGQGSKSIKHLADNLNCSVFVSHLPKQVYHHEIFAIITTGSVVALHINTPCDGCPFSAAKILFKYPGGAMRFVRLANSTNGLEIRNHHLNVVYNDHGMVKYAKEHQSRVIHIEGPYEIMNEKFWIEYFDKVTKYQLEYVGYLPNRRAARTRRKMEFRFARIEAQAQTILLSIINDSQINDLGYVTAKYGEDPCGRGWDSLPTK